MYIKVKNCKESNRGSSNTGVATGILTLWLGEIFFSYKTNVRPVLGK